MGALSAEGRTRKHIRRDSHQFRDHQLDDDDRNREGMMGVRGVSIASCEQLEETQPRACTSNGGSLKDGGTWRGQSAKGR